MAEKNLNIKVTADTKDAKKGLNKITEQINKVANSKPINNYNKLTSSFGKIIPLVTKSVKKAKDTLNELAQSYNVQAKAEKQLETAAKNNPYLNNLNVSALKNFASELQSISAVGDEELLPLMAQLAAAGRNQIEIQDIMNAAIDVSASGSMSLESAVKNLNKTYSGLSGELGESIPEIKNLTKEQLQNGEAIKIIQNQYRGMAEEVTKSTGGMTKFKNSVGDLKEILGEGVAKTKNAIGNALSSFVDNIANKMKIAKEEAQHFRDILELRDVANDDTKSIEEVQSAIDGLTTEINHLKDVKTAVFNPDEMKKNAEEEYKIAKKNLSDIRELKTDYEDLQIEFNEIAKKIQNEEYSGEELEIAKKRRQELLDIFDGYNTEYKKKLDDAEKKEKEAKKNKEKINKEIEKLNEEYKKSHSSEAEIYTGEALEKEIADNEKSLKQLKEKLELLEKEKNIKNEIDADTEKNEKAVSAKNTYAQKIEEYNKEAEIKRQIAKETNQEYNEEEEIAGRINLMQSELLKLLSEENGITIKNWQLQNDFIPALEEQLELYKKILKEKEKEKKWSGAKKIIEQWNIDEESSEEILQTQKETLLEYQAYLSEYGKGTEEEIALEEKLKNAISNIDDAMLEERKQKFQNSVNLVTDYINQFADISGQVTDLVRQSNENQTNEELNALSTKYTDGLISYEEYCDEKEQINKKSAQKEYKLKLWEWNISLLQATASIAQGVASCLSQGIPLGIINGALIGAAGALQIASLMASKPTPPAFASGGIVGATTGPDNTIATVRTGEMILNATQQKHLWELANGGKGGGTTVNMPVTIENRASNDVSAKSQLSADGLRIVIDKMVNDSIRKGRYTKSLQLAENNRTGDKIL